MLLYNHTQYLARWAGDRIGVSDFGPCQAIGVIRNAEIAAVAVFNQFRWPNIEISFVTADPRWATRQNIREIMGYPFNKLQCKRLTAITEHTNQRTIAFLCRLGFREEGYHPDVFENGNAAITYGLLRKDALRWIEDIPSGEKRRLASSSPVSV